MTYTILYIEDNPNNLRLMRKLLKNKDYNLLEADSGEVGFNVVLRELPDLVLMDINLPDVDGIEITRRIKAEKKLRHIPVVALTANAMFGDRERFLSEGCDGYLSKPIVRSELFSTLEHFLPPNEG